jgi:hypothetical protein
LNRLFHLLLAVCTAAVVGSACAPTYTSAGLGRYDVFQPFARMDGGYIALELARAGYVAVINVVLPQPAFRERPVLFIAEYPLWPTDDRHFTAGRHRLRARRETVRVPRMCGGNQMPTIDGCRRVYEMLPGVRSLADYDRSRGLLRGHYIVMVADEPIDPFTIAEELFHLALDRPDLTRRLRELDAELAAAALEEALLDRPGSPYWAALYVAAR